MRFTFVLGACLTLLAPVAGAQAIRVRVDSILLARDLDGNGKADYVVHESAAEPDEGLRPARVAIYLDAKPNERQPAWASKWDGEFGSEASLVKSMRIDATSSFVAVALPQADYEDTRLLVVARGSIRERITHGIDYGHGSFDIGRDRNGVFVDASIDHLVVDGKSAQSKLSCEAQEWSAVRLDFDIKTRQFSPRAPRCIRDQ
jgi:hypothetical protein